MRFRLLDWDTNLIGATVARMEIDSPDATELSDAIEKLRAKRVRLAYLTTFNEIEPDVAEKSGIRIVDRRTTFKADLSGGIPRSTEIHMMVKPYERGMPMRDLEALAIQSGEFSRFNVDPDFPKDKFEEMYIIWMRRSLDREIAEQVLTIDAAGRIVGMITIGLKGDTGEIGLLSVDVGHRGKGFGKALVNSATAWLSAHGAKECKVVTQGHNIAACRLYERCGFILEKVEYCYHLWL